MYFRSRQCNPRAVDRRKRKPAIYSIMPRDWASICLSAPAYRITGINRALRAISWPKLAPRGGHVAGLPTRGIRIEMNDSQVTEITDAKAERDLVSRIAGGEVAVVRAGLQQAGLLDEIIRLSYEVTARVLGDDVAKAVQAVGFERIHEIIPPGDVAKLADAIYPAVTERAVSDLDRLISSIFGEKREFYFETAPNVRFHIPFDRTRGHTAMFDAFAERRGEGKLSAHGPHRDSWLDCPDNGVNIWIAIGRVQHGNGLTIYRDQYHDKPQFTAHGDLAEGEAVTKPLTFDLAPGDLVLFHTDQLHGSELNRTDETRYVISYRITFDRPHFPRGHYHSYRSSRLARGRLKSAAFLPALLQPSYLRSLAERAAKRLSPRGRPDEASVPTRRPLEGGFSADMAVGEIRPTDEATCVARLSETEYAAFNRRCPHKGADLADGFVADGKIVCPWHNLPFDPATGASACTSLRPLAMRPVIVVDGQLEIGAADRPAKRKAAVATDAAE
jgi:nitrite reductase/ring-hydroxylating ferredoxin subunit